jgi:hypothetical protein
MTKTSMKLLLPALLIASLMSCTDKRAKECANKCAAEAEACQHRHEQNCEARGRECGQACEREAK